MTVIEQLTPKAKIDSQATFAPYKLSQGWTEENETQPGWKFWSMQIFASLTVNPLGYVIG